MSTGRVVEADEAEALALIGRAVDEYLRTDNVAERQKHLHQFGVAKLLRQVVDEEVAALGSLSLLLRRGGRRDDGSRLLSGKRCLRELASVRRIRVCGEREGAGANIGGLIMNGRNERLTVGNSSLTVAIRR